MGSPYPIVQMGTSIEEVSKLFNRDNAAVLIWRRKIPYYYKI
jgi:cystathionine beta-synthase